MSTLVVTTRYLNAARSQVWDTEAPLAIGHPLRWVLEKTEHGIRIRDLSAPLGRTTTDGMHEYSLDQLKKSVSLSSLHVQVKEVQSFTPAYSQSLPSRRAEDVNTGVMTVFTCSGRWTLASQRLSQDKNDFNAIINGRNVFNLVRSGASFKITAMVDGLSTTSHSLKVGQTLELGVQALIESSLSYGHHSWRFARVQDTAIDLNKASPSSQTEDNKWFVKAMRAAFIGLGVFTLMTLVWPKPDPKELVPAQFAKIVMTAPKAKAQAGASSAEVAVQDQKSNAPQKVKQAAVVQAFRAKALQSAVQGLLKGGMTKLLAQSDVVSGAKTSANVKRMFDGQNVDLKATAPITGLANRNVAVGAIGGQANGKGAGYGQGEHAQVDGQGSSFVSMDVGNASVEDGLTKDEVGEVIHRHISEVRYCYEAAILRSPDVEGKLIINFVIGNIGIVKSSEIKSSTLNDPRLDDCILRRLNSWKFPNPKGGVEVAVSYPFIFKTLGR